MITAGISGITVLMVFALLYTSLSFQMNPLAGQIDSRIDTTYDVVILVIKLLIAMLRAANDPFINAQVLLLCFVLTCYAYWHVYDKLPYYRNYLNILHGFVLTMMSIMMLGAAALKLTDSTRWHTIEPRLLVLMLSVVCGLVGMLMMSLRVWYVGLVSKRRSFSTASYSSSVCMTSLICYDVDCICCITYMGVQMFECWFQGAGGVDRELRHNVQTSIEIVPV